MRLACAMFGRRSLPIAVLAFLVIGAASEARAGYPLAGRSNPSPAVARAGERAAVLSVLHERIGDPALLEKARAKLAGMDDAEVRLLARLCDRISSPSGRDGFAADVAFLLVSALVVLS